MEETKGVVKWNLLALYLEIESDIIEKIKAECPLDVDSAKQQLFTHWIDNDLEASWDKLIKALESMAKKVLAKTIFDKIKGEWITNGYDCCNKDAKSVLSKIKKCYWFLTRRMVV